MVRRDDAMVARKLREPGAVRLQPLAGMEEQQRTPLPLLLDLQLDAGDGDVPAHAVPPLVPVVGYEFTRLPGAGNRGGWGLPQCGRHGPFVRPEHAPVADNVGCPPDTDHAGCPPDTDHAGCPPDTDKDERSCR